jgi:hypothetical protein
MDDFYDKEFYPEENDEHPAQIGLDVGVSEPNDEPNNFPTLPTVEDESEKQKLKAATHFFISKICEDEGKEIENTNKSKFVIFLRKHDSNLLLVCLNSKEDGNEDFKGIYCCIQ